MISKCSFCFTNVRHVKSDLSQLTDHAFSLAELPLVRFQINCCHGNTNRLYTYHLISQYSGIWKGVSGRVCVEWEAYQTVIYSKKGDAVTASRCGRLIAEEFNAGHRWILFDWALSNLCQVDGQINVGETQMIKFLSNRPIKSTLTTDQNLVKPALGQLYHVSSKCQLYVHLGM